MKAALMIAAAAAAADRRRVRRPMRDGRRLQREVSLQRTASRRRPGLRMSRPPGKEHPVMMHELIYKAMRLLLTINAARYGAAASREVLRDLFGEWSTR